MAEIDVRELKILASEILWEVRDHRARYVITYRGRAVGLLLPIEELTVREAGLASAEAETAWQELERLGAEIGHGWESPQNAAEIISETRR
ncbi:MAG: hypothetical protein EXR62_16110 [Chloroflexi bacterium]|nr:hypothetical protein [Chloroflexota bacterium]